MFSVHSPSPFCPRAALSFFAPEQRADAACMSRYCRAIRCPSYPGSGSLPCAVSCALDRELAPQPKAIKMAVYGRVALFAYGCFVVLALMLTFVLATIVCPDVVFEYQVF